MSHPLNPDSKLAAQQQAIRDGCLNPFGTFEKFLPEEIEQSIPDRFERMVQIYPDRIAIKTPERSVTYSQLNVMANRVAHTIVAERGTDAEPVGLFIEKGVEQIAAMLGILKAGKFFVLLDPSSPNARLSETLAELASGIVLTSKNYRTALGSFEAKEFRALELKAYDGEAAATKLQLQLRPSDYALIFYTSGSTGEPKGVIQNHRNLLHNVMLRTNALGVSKFDNLSLLASGTPNFVVNLFLGLLNGATVAPFEVREEGVARLAAWLLDEKITICWITAPLFRQLCETLTREEKQLSDIRHVVLASDSARKTDLDLFNKYFSDNTVFSNALTGSETGLLRIFSVHRGTQIGESDLPVGYPVDDKEILLLDDRGQQIGFNEIAEIVVKSKYLSPGYWHRPDLTEAKFRSDPRDPEKRLYHTGDLGLILPDGCLVHQGRKDFRVKIRGYGVEIAEVEKALKDHVAIGEAVVVGRPNETGEVQLIAYFTSSTQLAPTTSELRKFLSTRLQNYMIPSAFVKLNTLPLAPNGKVHRQALPELEKNRPDLKASYVAPKTPVEKALAKIWAEVLSVDRIGVHDDFFDLGGHSLLAAKLFARMDEAFGRLLPLSILFEAPTISSLAARYQAAEAAMPASNLVILRRSGTLPPIYAVPGVFGNVVGFADLSRELGSEQPFFGFNAIGLDAAEAPLESIEAIARRNVSEIRSAHRNGPFALIGACFGAVVAYEMARQLTQAGEEVVFLGLLDPMGLWKPVGRKHSVITPQAYKRAKAVTSLVVDRFRLYGQEIRGHEGRERLNYLARKIRSLSGLVAHNKRIMGVARELYELEVYQANCRASRRYELIPIAARLKAFEIFESSQLRNNGLGEVKWESLWQGAVVRHKVPGKDSGDMLSGENARVLAALLAERIGKAIEIPLRRCEAPAAVHRGQI